MAQGTPITAENLSADTKLILDEITRLLNLEKALPCYKYTVSVECLKAIRKLQRYGHLPSRPTLFKFYAQYGHYIGKLIIQEVWEMVPKMHVLDVRLAALECLVEFVKADGKADDLNHVLNIVENDPDSGLQHKLMQILVKDPPFKRAHRSKLDTPDLVERIWNNIKYYFFMQIGKLLT